VRVALETMAGQGNGMGHRFEQIAQLLDSSPQAERLGVCIDTCHIFSAGYDLRTPAAYQATIAAVEATIGLESLQVVHLNDSKGELGSHRDRHEHIGKGKIGLGAFWQILHDDRLAALPGILETPKSSDLHEDVDNLATLRELMDQAHPPQVCQG